MVGQGTIVATGSIAYPVGLGNIGDMIGAEKVMTMTSTYDHRLIQGAESGRFLKTVEEYLQGENGFYDGVFGPGTGSFLVFALVGVLGYAFLEASAQARVVNVATNLGAILVFAPQGAPLWGPGLCMGAAAVVGGYVGARTAIARGSRFVRVVFLVVVGGLALRLGYDVVT